MEFSENLGTKRRQLEELALGNQDTKTLAPELAQQIDALRKENQGFLQAHPFSKLKQRKSKKRLFQTLLSGGILGAAALLTLVFSLQFLIPGIRYKGEDSAALEVYRLEESGPALLAPGSTVFPGDILQMILHFPQDGFYSLLSYDSQENLTWHAPLRGGRFVTGTAGESLTLGHSFQLDATQGSEVFVLLYSKGALETDALGPRILASENQKDFGEFQVIETITLPRGQR